MTFRYKSDDPTHAPVWADRRGVAEVDPDLVDRDDNGQVYTVRYETVNAMLLNEFLKEHKKVEAQNRKPEQEATITQLNKRCRFSRCKSQRAGSANPESERASRDESAFATNCPQ